MTSVIFTIGSPVMNTLDFSKTIFFSKLMNHGEKNANYRFWRWKSFRGQRRME